MRLWVVGAFEKCAPRANDERKFVATVRLDFTHLADQSDGLTPAEIVRKAAGQKYPQKHFLFVIKLRVHLSLFFRLSSNG